MRRRQLDGKRSPFLRTLLTVNHGAEVGSGGGGGGAAAVLVTA